GRSRRFAPAPGSVLEVRSARTRWRGTGATFPPWISASLRGRCRAHVASPRRTRTVADGENDQAGRSVRAGGRDRHSGSPARWPDRPNARSDGGDRQPAGRRRDDRDGNTVLFAANPFVINPHLRKVSYDPLTSFEPICQLATAPTLIVVTAASPYHSLADLLAAARATPGSLTMASIGPGSPFHLG